MGNHEKVGTCKSKHVKRTETNMNTMILNDIC